VHVAVVKPGENVQKKIKRDFAYCHCVRGRGSPILL